MVMLVFVVTIELNTIPSLIAVDSPPLREDNPAYVSVSLALLSAGIKRPQIHAVDFTQGFLLLEDFGMQLLQPLLESGALEDSYDKAESTLICYTKNDLQSGDLLSLR